eukprot:6060668-Lingulodinium_polyedra.AAC.1
MASAPAAVLRPAIGRPHDQPGGLDKLSQATLAIDGIVALAPEGAIVVLGFSAWARPATMFL